QQRDGLGRITALDIRIAQPPARDGGIDRVWRAGEATLTCRRPLLPVAARAIDHAADVSRKARDYNAPPHRQGPPATRGQPPVRMSLEHGGRPRQYDYYCLPPAAPPPTWPPCHCMGRGRPLSWAPVPRDCVGGGGTV